MKVIFEDNHLLGVYKPAGLPVQGDSSGDLSLLDLAKAYIKERYNKPGAVFMGLIHRLDRPVSGVVLLARTSKALERMNAQFRNREVKKTYWAITKERPYPIEGHLVHYIRKDKSKNRSHAYERLSRRQSDAKKAELDYRLISEIDGHCLVEVKPLTGRPHQIRVQLATLGCPIVGDLKYGYRTARPSGNILLHSYSLEFIHPVKKTPVLIQALPEDDDLWNWFIS